MMETSVVDNWSCSVNGASPVARAAPEYASKKTPPRPRIQIHFILLVLRPLSIARYTSFSDAIDCMVYPLLPVRLPPAATGKVWSTWGGVSEVVLDDSANDLARVHIRIGLVDFIQRVRVGDELIELERAVHVVVKKLGNGRPRIG